MLCVTSAPSVCSARRLTTSCTCTGRGRQESDDSSQRAMWRLLTPSTWTQRGWNSPVGSCATYSPRYFGCFASRCGRGLETCDEGNDLYWNTMYFFLKAVSAWMYHTLQSCRRSCSLEIRFQCKLTQYNNSLKQYLRPLVRRGKLQSQSVRQVHSDRGTASSRICLRSFSYFHKELFFSN